MLILILVFTAFVQAAQLIGGNFCFGEYALCSSAFCTPVAGNSGMVDCHCYGIYQGLNIGHSSCQSRAENLTSTFSVQNQFASNLQPQAYSLLCSGDDAGPWASCLDAPCTTESGSVVCQCPVQSASENTFYTETCPTTAEQLRSVCAQMRSAALNSNTTRENEALLSSFYYPPPTAKACPPIDDA